MAVVTLALLIGHWGYWWDTGVADGTLGQPEGQWGCLWDTGTAGVTLG